MKQWAGGNELLTQCQGAFRCMETGESDSYMSVGYCFWVINGVVNTMVTYERICVAQGESLLP
ncbi:hypothetical protein EMIT0P176_70091 [Pseudomonas sp. IT-P176]